jgi:hypothetical protein
MTRAFGFANLEHIWKLRHGYNYLGNPIHKLLNYNEGASIPVFPTRAKRVSLVRPRKLKTPTVSSPPCRKAERNTDPDWAGRDASGLRFRKRAANRGNAAAVFPGRKESCTRGRQSRKTQSSAKPDFRKVALSHSDEE